MNSSPHVQSPLMQARGIDLECGCFGSATKNLSFTWHMVILVGMLAGLVALWFWSPSFLKK